MNMPIRNTENVVALPQATAEVLPMPAAPAKPLLARALPVIGESGVVMGEISAARVLSALAAPAAR